MKAILCRTFDGPQSLTVEDFEPPVPGDDEVLIAVHRASINYIDLLISRGLYQIRPEPPYVVGAEGAGEIVALGANVPGLRVGDRVATFDLQGAFAEQMTAKHWRAIKLPDGASYDAGAATLHNYVTAAYALKVRAGLRAGETLLVHGATGGVGLAAVELGKLWGAEVIAGVGADHKAALAQEYGATHVINYSTESIRDRVKDIKGRRGIDVIFDPIGGDVFDQSVRCLAWEGRLLVIGFASGRISDVGVNRPLLSSSSIMGVNTGLWPDQNPEAFRALADEIMGYVASGDLKPKISQIVELEDFRIGMDAIDDRSAQGRVVLKVR